MDKVCARIVFGGRERTKDYLLCFERVKVLIWDHWVVALVALPMIHLEESFRINLFILQRELTCPTHVKTHNFYAEQRRRYKERTKKNRLSGNLKGKYDSSMKFGSPFSLIFGTASAFVTSRSSFDRTDPTHLNLYRSVEAAIADAQRICAENPTSDECRVAWDIVEELEAADSHQGQSIPVEGSLDTIALVGSFEILTQKIDGKMDQLKATAMELEAMGAPGNMAELARLADEMKQALDTARTALR